MSKHAELDFLNNVIAQILRDYGDEFVYKLKIGKYNEEWFLKVIDEINDSKFLSYKIDDIKNNGIGWVIKDIEVSKKWSNRHPIF